MPLHQTRAEDDVPQGVSNDLGGLNIDGGGAEHRTSPTLAYPGFKLQHIKLPPGGHVSFSFRSPALYASLLDIRQEEGDVVVDGALQHCSLLDLRDRVTVLPPDCTMHGWAKLAKRPNSVSILYLDHASLRMELDLKERPEVRPMVRIEDTGLRQTLTKIHALPPPTCAMDVALLESLALVALVEIYRLNAPRPTLELWDRGQLTAHQQRIIREALADSATDLSLTGLASLVGLSRYHFARLFKKTYGLPPYQYVVRHRVEVAKSMLTDMDVDPRRLGKSLGFGNYGSFSKAFKQVTGLTPYRFQRVHSGRRDEGATG